MENAEGFGMIEPPHPSQKPLPLEQTDPELSDLLKWYANLPEHIRKRMGGIDTVHAIPQAGRNDPCPCGSLRKFKHCCLGK